MAKKSSGSKRTVSLILVLLIVVVFLALLLALAIAFRMNAPGEQEAPEPQAGAESTASPEPTAESPKLAAAADGVSSSLLCLDNYAVPPTAANEAAGQTVAVLGEDILTNAQLQIYYLNAIRTHRLSENQHQPEDSLPLEQQLCPLGDGKLSWQHYFLRQAIIAWQTEVLLLQAAQEPRIIQEEAFQPNATDNLHGKYISPDLPVNNFLYADKPCYIPNSMHQAYLDGLEEKMNSLASQLGFSHLSGCAEAVFGSAVSAQELVEAARRYNTAYMFFTEESYDISISQEEIDSYRKAHPEASASALTQAKQLEPWQKLRAEKVPTVDYSAAKLWVDPNAAGVLPVDVLYPDIAHERFPEVIVYFQQDYHYAPFGSAYVGLSGCGITTMAMLATYMTDTIYTPAMLAERFSEYYEVGGTKGELFQEVPEKLGFQLDRTSWNIDDAVAALENGQRVISLQQKGHFTSKGHYLLLQQYDPETDTFQVRDSNIYNYGRLSGHKVDYFTRADLLSGASVFYIMKNKVTSTPTCPRCGDNPQPEKLLDEAALCPRCTAALTRRNAFLSLMNQQ